MRHVWNWYPGTPMAACGKCGSRYYYRSRKARTGSGETVHVRVYISPSGQETERRVPPCKPRGEG